MARECLGSTLFPAVVRLKMTEEASESRTELEHDFLDAAKGFQWDNVKSMLETTPDLINVQPCGRWTALHQAAYEGNAEVAKYLLEKGASLTATNRGGKTALQVAKNAGVKAVLTDKPTAEPAAEPAEAAEATEPDAGEAEAPPAKKAKTEPVYTLNINDAVDKEFHGSSLHELCSAPTSALKGIGDRGKDILKKFKVSTIRGLGTWKFYRIAKSIVCLASIEQEGKREEGAHLNLNKALDKKHEVKSLNEILSLKPSALQGLAPWADDELAALGVTTVAKLGEWKFAKWSESIVELAEFENLDFSSM